MILIASNKRTLLSILYFSIFISSIAATASTTASLPSLTTTSSSEQSVSTQISTTSASYTSDTGYANSSISTSSTSHSYNATFTPIIPSSSDNQYIYHSNHIGGTVFIAVGSCLGFIILVIIAAWIIFGISAWNSARKEYKLKEIENKYQYDPFFFANGTDSSDNSINYSDGEDGSDISEKILKNKSSRLSLYSLGSTSVLNLLNQQHKDRDENGASPIDGAINNSHVNNANRNSLFISPTEILQNEANNSTLWNHSNANASSLFDSATSTPREQLAAQIISNSNMDNSSAALKNLYYHANHTSSTANLLSENMLLHSGDHALSPDSLNAKDISNETAGKKNYRPPSAHLDDLLNQDQDEDT